VTVRLEARSRLGENTETVNPITALYAKESRCNAASIQICRAGTFAREDVELRIESGEAIKVCNEATANSVVIYLATAAPDSITRNRDY